LSALRAAWGILCLAALCAWPLHAAAAERPLRVVTAAVAPFVLPDTDPPAGFSVDLWNEIGRRMHVESRWQVLSTTAELVTAVQQGKADVANGAITMTAEREAVVDFSQAYVDSGLQIMVRGDRDDALLDGLRSVPWLTIGQLFAAAAVLIIVLGHGVWLLERRHESEYAKPYLRAIGEGIWETLLIIATGEHTQRKVPGAARRVAVAVLWLVGIVLVAHLTATVTSSQTARRLQSSIQGPQDLPGHSIASVRGTSAADYLSQRGLPFVGVENGPEAIRMLTAGEVEAVVYDAPALQYWAVRLGQRGIGVVGPIFRPEKYGIAVAVGSPLRKRINEALLDLYGDGAYEKIHASWFSRAR